MAVLKRPSPVLDRSADCAAVQSGVQEPRKMLLDARDLQRVEMSIKRFLLLSDVEKSRLIQEHNIRDLVLDIDRIPETADNPKLVEDPIYGYLSEPAPKTKYRMNKRTAYYKNHLHDEVVTLRDDGWTFTRIEEYVRQEKKPPYKYTKEHLFRLEKKFR